MHKATHEVVSCAGGAVPKVLTVPDEVKALRSFSLSGCPSLETLILPVSTIIESGNHIAHIADGHIRREKAIKFQTFLKKTANEEAPWTLYGVTLTKEDLLLAGGDKKIIRRAAARYTVAALVNAQERIGEFERDLKFNANAQAGMEALLAGILEGR